MNTLDIIKAQVAESVRVKQDLLSDAAVMEKVSIVADVMIKAYRAGHKTLWAGNGGSAADAQHMAGELVNKFTFDRPGLPAPLRPSAMTMALTGCSPGRWKPRDVRGMFSSVSPHQGAPRTSSKR